MASTQYLFIDLLASDMQKAVRSAPNAGKSTSKDRPENQLIVESGEDPRSDKSHDKRVNLPRQYALLIKQQFRP